MLGDFGVFGVVGFSGVTGAVVGGVFGVRCLALVRRGVVGAFNGFGIGFNFGLVFQ